MRVATEKSVPRRAQLRSFSLYLSVPLTESKSKTSGRNWFLLPAKSQPAAAPNDAESISQTPA